MDTSDFSQESGEMDAGAFSERGHHLQAERESSIVIVMQGNNSASDFQEANRTTISRAHRQVLTEGGLSVTMAAPDQTYSGPSNVQVVTLDVDGSSVGWSSSQDEGVAEEVKDDETWPSSQKPDNVEMMTVDGSLAACLVCGDRASGYHYSVFSCEGCKGFFKRTVQKNLVYSCKDAGNCVINKYTRNSCQRCRFNKCISMGMKKEAVREDRSPGGKHRHKRPRTEHIVAMAAGEIMNSCGEEQEVHDSLLERLVAAQPDRVPKAEGTTSSLLSVNELMQYGYVELKFIIQWAKRVPGFQDLLIVDQMALLKSSFMELNVFRLAYRSMGMENMIKFADQISIPVDEVQTMGWGKELVNATVDFASKLLELNLDLTEFCILNAIVLTYPDASGIQDKVRVMTLQTRILDCLRCYMLRRYPNDNRRFAKMLLRLPALRTVSAKAAERFLSLTLDGSIQLNDIVLEMMN